MVLDDGGRKTVAAVAGVKLDPSYLHDMLRKASRKQSGNRYVGFSFRSRKIQDRGPILRIEYVFFSYS